MQIIPAIDLKDGRCVRLSQGQKETAKVYDNDPLVVAKRFISEGAKIIHVVDLDGAFAGRESSNRAVLKKIVDNASVPIQFGGGLRHPEEIADIIGWGVERVVLGTLATDSADTLKNLVERFGSHICVGIDARNDRVMTHGWQAEANTSITDFAMAIASLGVKRIVYTDIQRDGMLSGPNIEQTVALARKTGLLVTASGGVSGLDDIRRLNAAQEPLVDSVIVGRALYENRFTLAEALKIAS